MTAPEINTYFSEPVVATFEHRSNAVIQQFA